MEESGTKRKHLIYLGIGVVAVVGIVVGLLAGFSPKRSLVPNGASASDAVTATMFTELKARVATLEAKVSAQTTPKDWSTSISALDADITALETKLNKTVTDVNKTVTDKLAEFEPTTLPHYAIVRDISEKSSGYYIDVVVYGAGDYPVAVTIFGEGLADASISTNPKVDYSIADEYYYFEYDGCGDMVEYTIPNKNITSASGGTTEPHTHSVVISGLTFEMCENDFSNCSQAVIIVEHDDEWEAENLVTIKITGADAYYAIATVGASWKKSSGGW